MVIKKSIQKWNMIRNAISMMKCPLCEEYKTEEGCGDCPIKEEGKHCAQEYLDIHEAIKKFIDLLESKNGK